MMICEMKYLHALAYAKARAKMAELKASFLKCVYILDLSHNDVKHGGIN